MQSDDFDQSENGSRATRPARADAGRRSVGRTPTGGSSLGERLHRNLRGLIVATVLTLAAVAVLIGHYAL